MPNAVYEPSACIRATLEAARRVNFDTRRIIFEFTEDERIADTRHLERIVAEYKRLGFITALDDFGAGYAGLTLLANFQPDMIKIDMDLVLCQTGSRNPAVDLRPAIDGPAGYLRILHLSSPGLHPERTSL